MSQEFLLVRNAPDVTGKSVEVVDPAMKALPLASTAIEFG